MNENLSADQEIRVIALEYASKVLDFSAPNLKAYIANAAEIESYIREGTNGQ